MRAYEVFEAMRDRNLTTSLRSWSKECLGRAQNFGVTHQSDPLPPETALRLRHRLVAAGHHDLGATILISLLDEFEEPRLPPTRSP
jgi:hypothetical protein